MVTNLLWALGIAGVAIVSGSVFVMYEARQERLWDEQFRRELEELRQQYGND